MSIVLFSECRTGHRHCDVPQALRECGLRVVESGCQTIAWIGSDTLASRHVQGRWGRPYMEVLPSTVMTITSGDTATTCVIRMTEFTSYILMLAWLTMIVSVAVYEYVSGRWSTYSMLVKGFAGIVGSLFVGVPLTLLIKRVWRSLQNYKFLLQAWINLRC